MRRVLALAGSSLALARPALAAGEGGGGAEFFYAVLNFALLIAALVYFARKGVAAFFAERRERIREELERSAALLAQAEASHASWQRQLSGVEREAREIRETSRRLAEEERERLLAAARAAAERIRSDARVAIDREVERARTRLRAEALDLAVRLAAERLRAQIDEGDRSRLIDEFISRVERDAETAP